LQKELWSKGRTQKGELGGSHVAVPRNQGRWATTYFGKKNTRLWDQREDRAFFVLPGCQLGELKTEASRNEKMAATRVGRRGQIALKWGIILGWDKAHKLKKREKAGLGFSTKQSMERQNLGCHCLTGDKKRTPTGNTPKQKAAELPKNLHRHSK